MGIEVDAGETLSCLSGELMGVRISERTAWVARMAILRTSGVRASGRVAELCRLLRAGIPRETLVVGDVPSLVYRVFAHFDAYEPVPMPTRSRQTESLRRAPPD